MEYECRYCLEEDELKNLVSPCECNGTSRYIHPECLNRWRFENSENNHFNICIDCKSPYKYNVEKEEYAFIKTSLCRVLYILFYFLCLTINVVAHDYNRKNNTIEYKPNNKKDIYETKKIFIVINLIQNTITYSLYICLILLIRHKKKYIKMMYRYNFLVLTLFLQGFMLLIEKCNFPIYGLIFFLVGFGINYFYIKTHNECLNILNKNSIVYQSF